MKAKKKYLIEWRRGRVLELISKGNTQREIAEMLHVSEATICKDLEYLKEQSKENIRKYVDEKLPNEYEKCLVGLTAILRESWNMAQQQDVERREKIQALSLAKECYTTKLELLTNSTILADAMKFVTRHQNRQQNQNDANGNGKDEDNDMKQSQKLLTSKVAPEQEIALESEGLDVEDDEEEEEIIESEADGEEIAVASTSSTSTTTTRTTPTEAEDNETTTVAATAAEDQIF
jgi:predicted transcriptional regulator